MSAWRNGMTWREYIYWWISKAMIKAMLICAPVFTPRSQMLLDQIYAALVRKDRCEAWKLVQIFKAEQPK